MAECQYSDKICEFYNFAGEPGTFRALTPEYKERVCDGNYTKCQLWKLKELGRASPEEFKRLIKE